MRISLLLAALLGILTTFAQGAPEADAAAAARVNALLAAYSAKDVPAVIKMLDPSAAMYGTTASEFFTTPSGIEGLLRSDYRQWSSASFGSPRNVTLQSSGDLQTVFFDAPFTATYGDDKQRTFMIRFATVWHNTGGRWLLIQSMNAALSS